VNCFGYGIGNAMIFEYEKGYKVEECSPHHCLKRAQNLGRDNCSYRIRGIMKTIDVVEK
jgi:hypothetical protein